MNETNSLPPIVMNLIDRLIINKIIKALEVGKLKKTSSVLICRNIVDGNDELVPLVQRFVEFWKEHYNDVESSTMAKIVKVCAEGINYSKGLNLLTQIVWTGPSVDGSYVRATREVVKEIVRNSKRELMIVGYWLASNNDGEGIIEELIQLLVEAQNRGVSVTMILDERKRYDGTDNKQVLLDSWPSNVRLPKLLTWHIPSYDKHLKLHAKVIVADRLDGLITSANLTMYAMDKNIEMGIRVIGEPARTIFNHFSLLYSKGLLNEF